VAATADYGSGLPVELDIHQYRHEFFFWRNMDQKFYRA